MTHKWMPVYGTYDCPGRIRLDVDELGITIGRGKKALATTEWPGENIRLCELTEEPETAPLPEEVLGILKESLRVNRDRVQWAMQNWQTKSLEKIAYTRELSRIDNALAWLDSQ